MSELFTRCPRCLVLIWHRDVDQHKCPPMFWCRFDEPGNETEGWSKVYAPDSEIAVEQFVNQYSAETCEYVGPWRVEITSREPDEDNKPMEGSITQVWDVEAVQTITMNARLVKA